MRLEAVLHRLEAAAPDDVSLLAAGIAEGRIRPAAIVAVLGKTEGNGLVNDYSRGLATLALRQLLKAHLPVEAALAVPLVMSGGTEGGLSPHWLVLEAGPAGPEADRGPALAIGRSRTRRLEPHEIGTGLHSLAVAAAVSEAMRAAAIEAPGDVHYVQVKCPLLTAARIARAEATGQRVATRDPLKSMGLSRGAAALGVALALGEVALDAPERIGDPALWSGVASCSAGIELEDNEIVLMGQSPAWGGRLRIDHAVMADGFDVEPVRAALARLGLGSAGQLPPPLRERLVAVLAKAEAGRSGRLRGHRHTMLDDSDIASTRHARALVGGVLGGLVGHGMLFVSGGAEHQGPDGGGPVALIARVA